MVVLGACGAPRSVGGTQDALKLRQDLPRRSVARLGHMCGDGKICLVESMFHNGGKKQVRALSLMTLKHHFQSLVAGF
jgi:hypothetical protein